MISNHFSILALIRDYTFIFTWNIEMQSQKLDEFAKIYNKENNVFMIYMTLYWKDDLRSLKQICLINLKTALDSR